MAARLELFCLAAATCAMAGLGFADLAAARSQSTPTTKPLATEVRAFVPYRAGPKSTQIDFLDRNSLRKSGDDLSFDLLRVEYSSGAVLFHYRVSCGWRTARVLPDFLSYPMPNGEPTAMRAGPEDYFLTYDGFISADGYRRPFMGLIDELCANPSAGQASALASDKAAIDWARAQLPPPNPGLPSIPAVPRFDRTPITWASGPNPQHFVEIANDTEHRRRIFLDAGNLERSGDNVIAVSLVVAHARRDANPAFAISLLRRDRIDCSSRTLVVESEAFGAVHADLVHPPRAAMESPAVAAEIDRACSSDAAAVQAAGFASREEALASVKADDQAEDAALVLRLRRDAGRGDVDAMLDLAARNAKGIGMATNPGEAVKYYRMAAGKGSAEGMYRLGAAYLQGAGVAKDEAEGVRLYRAAANAGSTEAGVSLMFFYRSGAHGLPKDEAEAQTWARKAHIVEPTSVIQK